MDRIKDRVSVHISLEDLGNIQNLINQNLFKDRSSFIQTAVSNELRCYMAASEDLFEREHQNRLAHAEAVEQRIAMVRDKTYLSDQEPPQQRHVFKEQSTSVDEPTKPMQWLLEKAVEDYRRTPWVSSMKRDKGYWPNIWRVEIEEHMPLEEFEELVKTMATRPQIKASKPVSAEPQQSVASPLPQITARTKEEKIDIRRKSVIRYTQQARRERFIPQDYAAQYNNGGLPIKKVELFQRIIDIINALETDYEDYGCMEYWERILNREKAVNIPYSGGTPIKVEKPQQVLADIKVLYDLAQLDHNNRMAMQKEETNKMLDTEED